MLCRSDHDNYELHFKNFHMIFSKAINNLFHNLQGFLTLINSFNLIPNISNDYLSNYSNYDHLLYL